ncbi:MAG TPA: amino acid ABC transporter permease [Candidatus Saccharimonadales bacterium]|nr:amino acid ABC transporter permease [Candidatus Saccharimonadales bacterium]
MRWSRYFTASNEPGAASPSWPVRALNFGVALLAASLIFCFSFWNLDYHLRWDSIYPYRHMFVQGWLITIWISAAALMASTLAGFCSALAQRSRFLPLRYLSKIYVEVVRGTPLLAQILIFFYVVAPAFHVGDRYLVGILTLAFFSGAYISEIIRAGIESVGRSQLESAKAIGLTRAQTYRYVIIPQAVRQTLPPLAGQFVSLVKDSSLLSIIGISEFTLNAEMVNARTYSTLESYLPLAAGYLVLTLPISIWTRRLEQRHKFET